MKNVMVEKLQRGREDGISIDQIVTLKHLEAFEVELLAKIESLLSGLNMPKSPQKWLKSYQVKEMLGISSGTLQKYRDSGTLPFKRIEGTVYYAYDDIMKLMSEGRPTGRYSNR